MSGPAPNPSPPVRLDDLAERLGVELHGDPAIEVRSASTLAAAGPDQIAFLANPRYRPHLSATRAAAVIVAPDDRALCPGAALVTAEPYAAWCRLLGLWHPPPPARPGVAVTAVIDPAARIDPGAEIGPNTTIGAGATIAAGAIVGPGCVIEADVRIGAHSRLVANVYIGQGCTLGERVLVHPGVVIGADGFGLAMQDGRWQRLPQIGAVRIGDDCDIGANTTIDRGAVEDTVLGRDVRIDNQVQIAHNVEIGDHTAIAGCVGIAGSTRIGRYCMIAGASGIAGHLEICDRVVITAMSTVLESITEPGQYGSGIPALPMRSWQRTLVRLKQLDRLFRQHRNDSRN
jgi:UDP-3-O-[3-hydroxymyristoyl] glucosamine N-acyltransferase